MLTFDFLTITPYLVNNRPRLFKRQNICVNESINILQKYI